MSASVLYRIASFVLLLFAAGHALGFRTVDPHWGADAVVEAMRSVRFNVGSFNRGYWDFYLGAGYFVTAFLFFAAVLVWQFGRLKNETLRLMPLITWGLAVCFAGVTFLSWKFLFLPPIVFSALLTGILFVAAWVAGR